MKRFLTLALALFFSMLTIEVQAQTFITENDFNGFYFEKVRDNDPGTTFTSTPAPGGNFGDAITPFPSTLTVDERDFTPATANSEFAPNAYRYNFSDNADTALPTSAQFDLQTGNIGFDLSFDMQLNFGSASPRKEAGLRFEGNAGGALTFLATSNGASSQGGDVFVAGSGFTFRNFNADGIYANDGDVFHMRVIYVPPVRDENNPDPLTNVITPGTQEVRVSENDGPEAVSGPFNFTNLEQGLFDETSFRFDQQWQGDTENASDFATATYSNIVWQDPFSTGTDVDLNDDGAVDGADFLLIQQTDPSLIPNWQNQYGTGVVSQASASAVPEPTTLAIVLIGCASLATPRFRKTSTTRNS